MGDLIDNLYAKPKFVAAVRRAFDQAADETVYDAVRVNGEWRSPNLTREEDFSGAVIVTDRRVAVIQMPLIGKPKLATHGDVAYPDIIKVGITDYPYPFLLGTGQMIWRLGTHVQHDGEYDYEKGQALSRDRMSLLNESLSQARAAWQATAGHAERLEREASVDDMRERLRQQRGF